MKNTSILLTLSLLGSLAIKGQNIPITSAYAAPGAAASNSRTLTKTERDNVAGPVISSNIILTLTGLPAGNTAITIDGGPAITVNPAGNTVDITSYVTGAINTPNATNHVFTIRETAGGTITNRLYFEWPKLLDETEAAQRSLQEKENIIAGVRALSAFREAYQHKKNRVNLYFDERGKLLNYLPVNVDANDYFYMYVVCPVTEVNNYRINVTSGDYSPVDLAIRPFTKPIVIANATSNNHFEVVTYTVAELRAGPFTSDEFRFNIASDSSGKTFNGPSYSMKVNKLYHVGVGVSVIQSMLEDPEFRVVPLSTSTVGANTIEAYNTGSRTLLTFNVTWYWSVLQQSPKGSVVTSGRDILKDEPTFSLRRIYPTLGVSLNKTLNENIFAGFVYEFARGGSIIAGVHYGRVKELSYKNFTLGETVFTGADISTSKVYKSAVFIGVNVDTRIFNTLFGRGE